jgi:hypothetical protein
MPHGASRYGKEMRSVVPRTVRPIHEVKVGFMYQGSWAERMARPLASQLVLRDTPQVIIHEGEQLVEHGLLSWVVIDDQRRDVVAGGRHQRRAEIKTEPSGLRKYKGAVKVAQ